MLEEGRVRTLQEVVPVAGPTKTERPVIALALGGGGIRGYAHVGVLRALEEAGIRPDIVVGTSAGAVVGAAYASGMSAGEIDRAARDLDVSRLVDLTFDRRGFIRGDALERWTRDVVRVKTIEAMPIRFAAVATRLPAGEALLIDRGDVASAIRASAAVPGIMVPVRSGQETLVDGGISSLVPVRFARAMGADIVIAVDIYCEGPRYAGTNLLLTVAQASQAQSCLLSRAEMAQADIRIAPPVDALGGTMPDAYLKAERSGYAAARAAIPLLRDRLDASSETTAARSTTSTALESFVSP